MRILLTGGCGFIGWHVSRRLLEEGHEVVALDNMNDAYDVRLKEWRLAQMRDLPHFSFSLCDVSDLSALSERWSRRGPFDAVVDLAARAGVRQSLEDPWVYLQTNATGTLNLLELCRRSGTRKFVLASSSSVYGISKKLPYSEDQPTTTPISPYAASKIAAEAIVHAYHHLYGIDASVLRYFTVYGPAGRPDMSPFRFVRWTAEGHPVVIHGDGEQSRDYTYVGDIADGTVRALRDVGWAIINLGSNFPVKLLGMAAVVEEIVGKKAIYDFRPAVEADVRATWACIDRARELLSWSPSTPLKDGIARTAEWYFQNRPMASSLKMD
jgi:UDP-glucuronate 4-epimerase